MTTLVTRLDNVRDNDSNYDSDNNSAILDISDMIVTMIVTTVVLY